MEKEHLHLLINEEIYRLPDESVIEEYAEAKTETETLQVAEPDPEPLVNEEKAEPQESPQDVSEGPAKQEKHPETPEEWPFAVFHSSSNEQELELLHKIIAACKVPNSDYKIFNQGFDQSVKFKKALVFVPEAKAFYEPIPYNGSEFLCSLPLAKLVQDQNEKAKLWGALQKFVQ